MPHLEILCTNRFGDNQGTDFNDFIDVGSWVAGGGLAIDQTHPIEAITIKSGGVVDGMTITYRVKGGGTSGTKTFSHGTTTNSSTDRTINLGPNEVIVAVSGKSGHSRWGDHVNRISFTVLDTVTSDVRVEGPFGGTDGKAFHVEGVLLALAGTSYDAPDPVGLNSLSFYLTPCDV